tara:strand:- start:371 stop:952 length:582 start_codon:yes stop_codon:yes gene_type:complete
MSFILSNLKATVLCSFLLAFLFIYTLTIGDLDKTAFFMWILRWLHVISAIMWVGILYYFNFVQIPNMGKIPDEQKPAISKVIAPASLFWFRWGSVATVLTGLKLAYLNGYLHQALTFSEGFWGIGLGMWLGIIMFINVWGVIWPNQKRALGIIEVDEETKAKSARTAMLFSRTNTLLSIPMLVGMTVAQNSFA